MWHRLWPDFWNAVYPNILASFIWGCPAFITHHVLIRRHITRNRDE